MTINVLFLAPSPQGLARLTRDLVVPGQDVALSTRLGGIAELTAAIERNEVDLAVVQMDAVSTQEMAALENAWLARPASTVILVTHETASDFLMHAMRAGVREVVPAGAPAQTLAAAFARQFERLCAVREPVAKGQVIAFMPAKGGSGATFLATNLAFALARQGRKVVVLDLNLQFGDVALFVSDRRPSATIADVAREVARLDAALLESSMMHPSENLWVLAAPDSPERSVEVKPEAVERIITLCRQRFDFVVLDVGRILESVSIRALDQAATIYLVLQATLPTLHDGRRLISVLNGLGYGRDKLKIVLNRLERGGDIGVGEVSTSLGYEIAQQIPNSYANVVHSVNHGIPILSESPKDPVSQALVEWAHCLSPQPEKPVGWLRSMFSVRA